MDRKLYGFALLLMHLEGEIKKKAKKSRINLSFAVESFNQFKSNGNIIEALENLKPDDRAINSLGFVYSEFLKFKSALKNKSDINLADAFLLGSHAERYISVNYSSIRAIRAKLENDPKQLALKSIENEFKCSKYPFNKRGYKTKFIKEMWDKYPIIENIKTIERLVSKLYKTHSNS